MDQDLHRLHDSWAGSLKEWPIERLRRMTLQEHAAAGENHTFIAWIEERLDQLGSIWGGSAFKFGIYSRKDRTPKTGGDAARASVGESRCRVAARGLRSRGARKEVLVH